MVCKVSADDILKYFLTVISLENSFTLHAHYLLDHMIWGLHYLPFIQRFPDPSTGSQMELVQSIGKKF